MVPSLAFLGQHFTIQEKSQRRSHFYSTPPKNGYNERLYYFYKYLINLFFKYWYASLLLFLTLVCLPLCIRIGLSLLGFFVCPSFCMFSNLFRVIKSDWVNIKPKLCRLLLWLSLTVFLSLFLCVALFFGFEFTHTPVWPTLGWLSRCTVSFNCLTLELDGICSRNFVFCWHSLHSTVLTIYNLRILIEFTWPFVCLKGAHFLPHSLCERTVLTSKCKYLFRWLWLFFFCCLFGKRS